MMSDASKYKCTMCPFSTVTQHSLGRHVMSHTKEKPYKCPDCTAAFCRTDSLKFHVSRFHSPQARQKTLQVHLLHYAVEKPFLCPENGCDKAFVRKSSLKPHIRVHTGERPFKCEFQGCEYRARLKQMLREHRVVHDNERPFKCPVPQCNHSAKLQKFLNNHTRKVHRPPKYPCSYPNCDFKGRQRSHVTMHENTHSGSRPFKCPFPACSHSAKSLSNLWCHKKAHTSNTNPQRCNFPDCNRRFRTGYKLREHERFHNGEEPYKCNFSGCEHKTWVKAGLKTHQKLHKLAKLPCPVNECTYAGKTHRQLKRHAEYHKSPAYSSCPTVGCSFFSTSAKTMAMHKKVHDSEGKIYSCPLCPCYFKWQGQFEAHLRSHNGEKPYKCPDCQYRCVHVYGVVSHFKRIHGRELSLRDVADCRNKNSLNRPNCSHRSCLFNSDGVCNLKRPSRILPNSVTQTLRFYGRKNERRGVGTTDVSEIQTDLRDCFVPLVRITVLEVE